MSAAKFITTVKLLNSPRLSGPFSNFAMTAAKGDPTLRMSGGNMSYSVNEALTVCAG